MQSNPYQAIMTDYQYEIFKPWLEQWISYDQVQVLQNGINNIGMALLALLIPVSIFLFENVKGDGNSRVWDSQVLVKEVLQGKNLFIAILLIFLPNFIFPLIYFKESKDFVLFYLILIFFSNLLAIAGYYLLVKSLISAYYWLTDATEINDEKSYRNLARLKFLDEQLLPKNSAEYGVWAALCTNSAISPQQETQYFRKFEKALRVKVENKDYARVANLLTIFKNNIEKRTFTAHLSMYDFLYQSYFIMSPYKPMSIDSQDAEAWELESAAEELLKKIIQIVTEKPNGYAIHLFKSLKLELEARELELHELGNSEDAKLLHSRMKALIEIHFDELSQLTNVTAGRWLSNSFPQDWVIKRPVENDKHDLVRALWFECWHYAFINKIWTPTSSQLFDKPLDSTFKMLFGTEDCELHALANLLLLEGLKNSTAAEILNTHLPVRTVQAFDSELTDGSVNTYVQSAYCFINKTFGCTWVASVYSRLELHDEFETSLHKNKRDIYLSILENYQKFCAYNPL